MLLLCPSLTDGILVRMIKVTTSTPVYLPFFDCETASKWAKTE